MTPPLHWAGHPGSNLHSAARWTRRTWLSRTAGVAVQLTVLGAGGASPAHAMHSLARPTRWPRRVDPVQAARATAHAEPLDPSPLHALVQRAVDAARSAGATYADAKITRTVRHRYVMADGGRFLEDEEMTGVGVRTLVNGAWGFAACPYWEMDEVVRMAQDAVRQAKDNSRGVPRTADFGRIPVATGTWATPIRIDPFTIPIEEKLDYIGFWADCGAQVKYAFPNFGYSNEMQFVRQERIVATSDGALFTQTIYESRGQISYVPEAELSGGGFEITDLWSAGKGWELFLDAKIPDQILAGAARPPQGNKYPVPMPFGRYPIVCDGVTMGVLLESTFGVATQLDRALGYEANASGTSFLDDPLAMIGHFQVASPLVTVTANRSAPAQLATVKWDDEGVEPPETMLIKDGVLTDFQTTREQAAWLAPYYQAHNRPVRSNGCAGSDTALSITMQHVPNLALVPNPIDVRQEDLVRSIKHGLLVRGGAATTDFQARNGMVRGGLFEIRDGQVKNAVRGMIQFNTLDLWRHITALGGASTLDRYEVTQYSDNLAQEGKGQPRQYASHSVRAVAATIQNQALIPSRDT